MPISVYIPAPLLAAVDKAAKKRKISRNRLILQSLERELAQTEGWSPGFFAALAVTDEQTRADADALLRAVKAKRKSKAPPRL